MFIGIDLHKQFSYVTSMNEKGVVIAQKRIEHDPESLGAFIQSLNENDSIAVEATCNWYYIYELLEKKVSDISLAHPLKTRHYCGSQDQNRQNRFRKAGTSVKS